MESNIDIRPVLNHCKVVTYTCAYFYKADNETSKTMKQVAKEAYQSGKSALEKIKQFPESIPGRRNAPYRKLFI